MWGVRMKKQSGTNERYFGTSKIIHYFAIVTILVAALTLLILRRLGLASHQDGAGDYIQLVWILYIGSASMLVVSFKSRRLLRLANFEFFDRHDDPAVMAGKIHQYRLAVFGTVVACGFVLGLLGVSYPIIAPFFVAAVVATILTYPTKKKWDALVRQMENEIKSA